MLIVVYRPRLQELQAGLEAIAGAYRDGVPLAVHLWHNDDGSRTTPGLAELCDRLRSEGLPMRVEGGRGNLGFGRAINAQLATATEPYLLLLNQDAIPEPGSLQRLWQTASLDDAKVAAWEMRQVPYEHPKDYDPLTLDTVWCSGAAVLLRASALREVAGFEPRFFMYCEDVDLCWRLRCAGWRLRYLPQCAVVHHTYSEPGEIKPLMVLQGCYANLCLRTRYAGRRQVLQGVRQLLQHLRGPQPFVGHRQGLVRALLKFAGNYAYFRRTRQAAPDFEPCLRGWDYEMRREGSFHAFLAQAQQALPRPLVSVLVVAGAATLSDQLRCLAGQTHSALQFIVLDTGVAGVAAAQRAYADRFDVRTIRADDDARIDQQLLAAVQGDWVMMVQADGHLLYADHVEVLLQAAIEQQAAGASGQTWRLQAPASLAREAHRLNAPRGLCEETLAQRPAVVFQRRLLQLASGAPLLTGNRPWLAGTSSDRIVEVPKVTAVRYLDSA